MPYSPLILFWIKGLLLSRHTPEFPAFLGFLICVRENAPPSHSKQTQAIPAGVRGGCGTKYDFNVLRLRIEAIIGSYTMDFTSIFEGRFSSGKKIILWRTFFTMIWPAVDLMLMSVLSNRIYGMRTIKNTQTAWSGFCHQPRKSAILYSVSAYDWRPGQTQTGNRIPDPDSRFLQKNRCCKGQHWTVARWYQEATSSAR